MMSQEISLYQKEFGGWGAIGRGLMYTPCGIWNHTLV